MDHQESETNPARRRKYKPELEFDDKPNHEVSKVKDLVQEIRTHVDILNSTFSPNEADRAAANNAVNALVELATNEETVNLIVDNGAVPVLVKNLQTPLPLTNVQIPYEHEVEKGSALVLGLLASKPEHQQLVVDAGALSHLVALLKRHKNGGNSRALSGVIQRAANAITSLADDNANIQARVRIEDGIPPLVELLNFVDARVQGAAAAALRTLAFRNKENKKQIVACNALQTLVLLLRSEDATIYSEVIGAISSLVYASPDIKKEVLLAGALQPIIGLLSSSRSDCKIDAAWLLGQFSAADSNSKVHIVQRGAVRPLIEMLRSSDSELKEMSAFALARLAKDTHNQAGIAQDGAILPLLMLLDSKNGTLQHHVAFTLFCLADNEDNVADLVRLGGVQKLQNGEFTGQPTKDCVARTLERLEEKIRGQVLKHLLYLMQAADTATKGRIALALAHLCAPEDCKTIFIDNNGLELLLGLLESKYVRQKESSLVALYKLATKATSVSPRDAACPLPTPKVYLGEQFVNNPVSSDVTFVVEGKQFYAHRNCLVASSDAFRAMLDGGYKEKYAKDVEIPNIRWDVFELMMRYIYTGSVDVNIDIAQDLLRAADQYLLEGLKQLCEYTIAQNISVGNIMLVYGLSEVYNAITLRQSCILLILEQFEKIRNQSWFFPLIHRILPEIRNYFTKAFSDPANVNSIP